MDSDTPRDAASASAAAPAGDPDRPEGVLPSPGGEFLVVERRGVREPSGGHQEPSGVVLVGALESGRAGTHRLDVT